VEDRIVRRVRLFGRLVLMLQTLDLLRVSAFFWVRSPLRVDSTDERRLRGRNLREP